MPSVVKSMTAIVARPQQIQPATMASDGNFEKYTRQLTLVEDFIASLRQKGLHQTFKTVDFKHLTETNRLPGKNHARVVVRAPMGTRHVFKGFDLEAFNKHEHSFYEHQRDTMLHEIQTLAALPLHPNIMPCPETLVTVLDPDGGERVCGFLQPVMERETLDDQITNAGDVRIPLLRKAKWCFQMARAVLHTHRIARTYHMDVKPGNILIDQEDGIRLIDWEQSGVSMFTHSKEATIDQEAWEEPPSPHDDSAQPAKPRIVYKPHAGAPRKNLHWGYPDWNVFPIWKKTCPRAAELAEVFSLGRVMWMLMEQLEQSPNPTVWTARSADVPQNSKDIINQCMELDPNARPDLDELVDFWSAEVERLSGAKGASNGTNNSTAISTSNSMNSGAGNGVSKSINNSISTGARNGTGNGTIHNGSNGAGNNTSSHV
ncbi:hypothetical protein HYQ45_017057 [Verticillium longisporum]|uniref:Protein kinase domain-containing protein n=1 Tax=Verticillium longisporum TaxID=100787 RepID=A0A8I2Z3C4_VERLO|nr:hypothetical protein HYQ45_017057 [Verticillium longisporum]